MKRNRSTTLMVKQLFKIFCIAFAVLKGIDNSKLSAQDSIQKIIPGRANAPRQQNKPYVILISVDGLRYDFVKKFNAENILGLAGNGVIADGMRPGFPTTTFPNHYSIVTGLYPGHHGLIDNFYYDPARKTIYNKNYAKIVRDSSWYKGRPLWVLAEQQQMISASFYWVGSEAPIMGKLPTYYYTYSTLIPEDNRIRIVRDWLELPAENRPHLICLYFNEIDDAGHSFGPDAPETAVAVRKIDAVIGKLAKEVAATGLAVNFILVSDHGMAMVDHTRPLRLPREVDTTKFVVPRGDAILQLYAKEKSVIMPTYKALRANANGFKVYLKNELPPRWQLGGRDDRYNRVGDIVLIPNPNLVFNITQNPTDPGKHGFDNNRQDMAASFFAWGPAFKPKSRIRIFDNVHVFPLVAKILGLEYNDKIDGKLNVLQPILR